MASDHRRRHFNDGPLLGASKAQAALAKIIAVISTVPPPLPTLNSKAGVGIGDSKAKAAAAAVVLDLNLRLGPEIDGREPADDVGGHSSLVIDPAPTTAADSVGISDVPKVNDETISPAESVAGGARIAEKSSEGECDPHEGEEEEIKKEEEVSEIAYVNQQQQQRDETGTKNKNGSGGYLDLLLEAVQHELSPVEHIEKEEEEEDTNLEKKMEPSADISKRVRSPPSSKRSREAKINWPAAEFDFYGDDAAPIVRSNRGRKQTLPSRYRDSVIEPWAKPPTVNRHGTGTSARVTGRRSRRRTRTPTP